MYGDYGLGSIFGLMQQASAAATAAAASDTNDEEIAFQLQLEAIAESYEHRPRPNSQSSLSSFQNGASSSGSRVVSNSINPGQCSGAPLPTRPRRDVERTPGLAFRKFRQTGAKAGTGAASASVDSDLCSQEECVICTEMRARTSFISATGCTHEYCSDCCQHYAEEKVASGSSQIQCPHEGCRHCFDIQQCKELLSHANFDILTTRQTEAAIPPSRQVYCPHKGCSAFMEKAKDSKGSQFVECGACHRGFCVKCNIPWHANMTCSQYRADVVNRDKSGDKKLEELAKKEKWQSCPKCKRVIELRDGCYHMTCLCGNEFCYTCGAKWTNKGATCKCKLWDVNNIIRPRARRPRVHPLLDPFPVRAAHFRM